jgi:hypothetical protein
MSSGGDPHATDADRAELARQRRLVDQMATMHALLRDRYRAQFVALRMLQLTASVVATAFAFASTDVRVQLGPTAAERGTVLGWLAVAILTATVADLVLDRGGAASRHDAAVRQLSALKTGYRAIPEEGEVHQTRIRMTPLYESTMESLPAIPERRFNPLKARHLHKVEVSRYLSRHPGASAAQARRAIRREVRDLSGSERTSAG